MSVVSNSFGEYRVATEEEVKKIQLLILREIDVFCRSNKLRFCLAYGSLIGAVRHKGFIPWDDDIDIWMFRKDYEVFIRKFNDYNSKMSVRSYLNSDHPFPYAKVIYNDSRAIEIVDRKEYTFGISIDLFPIDNMPDSDKEIQHLYKKTKLFRTVHSFKTILFDKKRKWYKNAILHVGNFLFKPIPVSLVCKRINDRISTYNDENSTYVADFSTPYGMRPVFLRDYFSKMTYTKFEELSMPIPIGYDNILRTVYGDYMVLPPVEKQVSHHDNISFIKDDK